MSSMGKIACILAAATVLSTSSTGVVSGALHPFRRGVNSLAFMSRDGVIVHGNSNQLRKIRDRHNRDEPLASLLDLNIRGGGDEESAAADDDDREEDTDGAGQAPETTDGTTIVSSPQQDPVVDVSVVESNEIATEGGSDDEVEVDSVASENGPDEPVKADEEEDDSANNEGDVLEATTNPIDNEILDEGVISEADDNEASAEESTEESSDTDTDTLSTTQDAAAELLEGITARELSKLQMSAAERRAEGKSLHDGGSLTEAAQAFGEAASLLDQAIEFVFELSEESVDDSIAVERATCRLHEALCLLKDGRPGDCVEACTDVLEDGVTVVLLEDEEMSDKDDGESTETAKSDTDSASTEGADGGEDSTKQKDPTVVVKIIPPPEPTPISSYKQQSIPPQIRARAHHRRAKARLALGDLDGALEDARSAAFMGDRNAVQFYGRLMREGSGAANSADAVPNAALGAFGGSPFGSLSDNSNGAAGAGGSNPFLEGILGGMSGSGSSNPLMPSLGAGSNNDFSSSLLSSLLTGSGDSGGGSNPFGLMGELLSPPSDTSTKSGKRRRRGKKNNKGGMDSLAKSVLSNLMKRIEDEDTQETICKYLNSANTQQIMSFSTMAGIPMKEESARRLVTIANGVTPKGISKSVSRVKRGISIVKTVRKILKVIDKYKAFIILGVACYWIRSAITQPYTVSKKQAKKLAEKTALSLLVLPSSQGRIKSLGSMCGNMITAYSRLCLSESSDNIFDEELEGDTSQSGGIEEELERLQNQLTLIEALEERNKAQLDSFVDEEDQWESLEEYERELLSSKQSITERMETMSEELVLLFMGQKMSEG